MPKRLFGKKETAERAEALARLKREKRQSLMKECETKMGSNGEEYRIWKGTLIPTAKVTLSDIEQAQNEKHKHNS